MRPAPARSASTCCSRRSASPTRRCGSISAPATLHKPPFTEINPKGKVPTLQRDDGLVITEYPVIAHYLAQDQPGGRAAAERRGCRADRGVGDRFLRRHHPHAGLLAPVPPGNFSPNEADHEAVKARGRELIEKGYAIMDKALDGKEWIAGDYSYRRFRAVLRRVLGRQAHGHAVAAALRRPFRAHARPPRGAGACWSRKACRPDADADPAGVLVPSPRRDRLERPQPRAGPRRHPAQRDRPAAGARRRPSCCAGAASAPSSPRRSRAPGTTAEAASAGDRPPRPVRSGAGGGRVRRPGGPADAGRMVRRLGRRALHPGRRRKLRRAARARGRAPSTARWRSRRRCWSWRTGRCSGRCARRWASIPTSAPPTASRCSASPAPPARPGR